MREVRGVGNMEEEVEMHTFLLLSSPHSLPLSTFSSSKKTGGKIYIFQTI
jgi:hypothetical protein